MSGLQKIKLGTPPGGRDGDDNRVAHLKTNENFDVVGSSTPLGIAILNDSADLTPDDVGKRFGLYMPDESKAIGLPLASSVRAGACIHLFCVQHKVSIKFKAGDLSQLGAMNAGDWVTYVADGAKIWHAAARGRMLWDEVVGGKLTVGGDLSAAIQNDEGHLVLGKMPGYFYGSSGSVGWWSPDKGSFQYVFNDRSFSVDGNSVPTVAKGHTLQFDWSNVTPGQLGATVDKTYIGYLWHSRNLAQPMTLDTPQTISGAKIFSATSQFSGLANFSGPYGGTYATSQINISSGVLAGIGFNSNGIGGTFRLVPGSGSGMFQALNYDASAFIGITCSTVQQTSDVALKTGVRPISGVLEKLRDKRVVRYRLKIPTAEGGGAGAEHIGVIAQEWQDDFPELVSETGVDIDGDGDFIAHQYDEETGEEIFGENGPPQCRKALGFNYANASAVAIEAVIELDRALTAALDRIAVLERKAAERVAALEASK
ncbi:tail fiber domain-containing protein [Burkholderia mayonis]|uniref:Peptidase S74 domain-containing protein n=1 Tax=Burkholderia mayonis TaxID=1385591 RepID=A0A1B4FV63_9BURK|nr:tail fiber domain-containing protein [Burkholderia mayonis]AOJ07585.1 hypothetical protein WS71_09875 [Burkholderia mayonis]KVE58364.1 hypothetical protein WS71_24775 [Burkholderia mayonis]